MAEWTCEAKGLRELVSTLRVQHPKWEIGSNTLECLYVSTHVVRPHMILETGVADGFSTFAFLKSLKANNFGRLVSVDISPDVGRLISFEDRGRWDLRILSPTRLRQQFEELVRSLGSIDYYYHDSDHSYQWQKWQYSMLHTIMSRQPPRVFASDDVGASYAFFDVCASRWCSVAIAL
jgi:hypothetical protein